MITLGWDVDDVTNNLMQEWFEKKWLPKHLSDSPLYEKLTENPPHKILGISQEKYLASLDKFRLSKNYLQMKPVAEVEAWFLRHGDNFRHVAITAVPVRAVHASAAWLLKTFGRWIRTYHFVPAFRKGEILPLYDHNKQDIIKWFNKIDVFIDDSEINLKDIEKMGVKGVLFPRPWNSNKESISETLEKLTEYVYQLKNK